MTKSIVVACVLAACGRFPPGHTWYYWPPDRTNPTVEFGDYRIELSMRDWNVKQLRDKEVFDVGIALVSEYMIEPPDSLIIKEERYHPRYYPKVVLEFVSFCVQFPDLTREKMCPQLKHQCDKYLWKNHGRWNGTEAHGGIDMVKKDSIITAGFTARLVDTLAQTVVAEESWFFELKLVKDRYWYFMR